MALYRNSQQNPDDPPRKKLWNSIVTAFGGTPEGYVKTGYVNPDGSPEYVPIGTTKTSPAKKPVVSNPTIQSAKIAGAGLITGPNTKIKNRFVTSPTTTHTAVATTPVTTTPITKKKKPLAQTKNNAIAEDFNSEMLRNPNATQFGWNENGIIALTPEPLQEEVQQPLAPRIEMTGNGEQVIIPQETTLESGVVVSPGTYTNRGIQKVVANQAENGIGKTDGQVADQEEDTAIEKSQFELDVEELMKNYDKNQKDKKTALAGKYAKDNLMTMLEFLRNEKQGLPEDVPTPVMRTPDLIDTTSADLALLRKKEAEGYSAIREVGNAMGNTEIIKSASASLNNDVMTNVINLAKQKQANMNTQKTLATDVANKNNFAAAETKKLNLERTGLANEKTGAIRSQLLTQFGKMDADFVTNNFKLKNQAQNQRVFKILLDQYKASAGDAAYASLIAQFGLSGMDAVRTEVAPNSAAAEEKQGG